MTKQYGFSKGELAEIKELYDGTAKTIRELAKLFKCSDAKIRWTVNYKNYREEQKIRCKKWKEKNKEKVRKQQRLYHKIYYHRNREKILEKTKDYYQKNIEKKIQYQRDYYKNKKSK